MRKFLLVLAGAIIVMLALLVWFYPSSKDFRSDKVMINILFYLTFINLIISTF